MKRTKTAQAIRKEEVANGLARGAKVGDMAEELKVSRQTISADIRELTQAVHSSISMEDVVEVRKSQLEFLSKLVEDVLAGKVSQKTADAVTRIHGLISNIVGTNAPKKHLNVNVDADPRQVEGYRRFLAETRHLSESDLEQVWQFCRNLRPQEEEIGPR